MAWEVLLTREAEDWYMKLDSRDAEKIAAPLDELERQGPQLGRPFVDSIKASRHHNMKELRSVGGHLRALFAFDPQRQAIVLLGGDKTNDWEGWYRRMVPRADRVYDQHLRTMGDKPTCRTPRAGGQSAASGR